MFKRRLGIIGSSGYAREATALASSIDLEVVGYIEKSGVENPAVAVLGFDEDIDFIIREYELSHIHVGIGDAAIRREVVSRVRPGYYGLITHDTATVMSNEIGEGTIIYPGAVIMPGCNLGTHCLVNAQAYLGHDVSIGDFCNIGPAVSIAGNVVIGSGTIIGVGASIKDGIRIGLGVTVGAGAVVVQDIPDHVVSYGNPSRPRS